MQRLELEICKRHIDDYNRGFYRGKPNVELDRTGYQMFAQTADSCCQPELVELVRFIGEDYGGAQDQFLDVSYLVESERIGCALLPHYRDYVQLARGQAPLVDSVPARETLAYLVEPFHATKFWIVWASKFLHFLAPRTFPILDSRAKAALGFPRASDPVRYYQDFSSRMRDVLLSDAHVLRQLCDYDPEDSPVLKVLDKVLYEVGASSGTESASKATAAATQRSRKPASSALESRPQERATVFDGGMIPTRITNIASHAARARSGDRFELCIAKEHASAFPDHKEQFELRVAGVSWRVRIGKRDGVKHLYVLTECTSPDQRVAKITEVLRSVGVVPGDEPMLKTIGHHQFELVTGK